MVITSDYRLDEQGGLLFCRAFGTSHCPVCTESLSLRGCRERGFIDAYDQECKLVIRRLFCGGCEKIHHELPDCLVPYKRHCAETFEKIVQGKTSSAQTDGRVIRRVLSWWTVVLPYFMNILKSLSEKHKTWFKDMPAFKEIIRAVCNSNNWIFVNQICTRSGAHTHKPA